MPTITQTQALELEKIGNISNKQLPIRPDGWIDKDQYAEAVGISRHRARTHLMQLYQEHKLESILCFDPEKKAKIRVYKTKDTL